MNRHQSVHWRDKRGTRQTEGPPSWAEQHDENLVAAPKVTAGCGGVLKQRGGRITLAEGVAACPVAAEEAIATNSFSHSWQGNKPERVYRRSASRERWIHSYTAGPSSGRIPEPGGLSRTCTEYRPCRSVAGSHTLRRRLNGYPPGLPGAGRCPPRQRLPALLQKRRPPRRQALPLQRHFPHRSIWRTDRASCRPPADRKIACSHGRRIETDRSFGQCRAGPSCWGLWAWRYTQPAAVSPAERMKQLSRASDGHHWLGWGATCSHPSGQDLT